MSEYPLTVIAFWIAVYFLAVHDFVKFIRSLFANREYPSEEPVKAKKKYIVSAATYVR